MGPELLFYPATRKMMGFYVSDYTPMAGGKFNFTIPAAVQSTQ
jgi:hypothetical protein